MVNVMVSSGVMITQVKRPFNSFQPARLSLSLMAGSSTTTDWQGWVRGSSSLDGPAPNGQQMMHVGGKLRCKRCGIIVVSSSISGSNCTVPTTDRVFHTTVHSWTALWVC